MKYSPEKVFLDLKYKPSRKDLICLFRIEPEKGISMKKAAANTALESSVGTWDKVEGLNNPLIRRLGAKVFSIKGNFVKIAYPLAIFELGNMPSILSGIAGNIFGMKMLKNLRLEDIEFPKKIIKSFKGPKYGVKGVRKLLKIKKRPLVGTIVKPKLGLTPQQHAEYAYKSWKGGLDLVKSDENLTNQTFNKFKERFKKTIKLMEKVERETGEKKIYVENVTAETREMLKRVKFIENNNGNCAMIDFIVSGWSSFQTIRDENPNLILHLHRSGHGMFTENPKHGMSMLTVAKIARLIGGDNLHIGAVFGKMKGGPEEIITIKDEIEKNFVNNKHILNQRWYGIKPTFAVCSGGLYPGALPKLIKTMGNDIICQAGGGVSANPLGIEAGARAMRQAVDATMKNISLKEHAENNKELKAAIDRWGIIK